MKIAIVLCALAGCIDPSEQLGDTEQAVDLSARDRFISLNTAGNAWSRVQAAPNSSTYDGFELVGDTGLTKLATERNQDGRLSVFAIGSDGALWARYQTAVGGGWNADGWQSMGGAWIVEIATARNVDGRIEVFVRNQWGNVFHRYQVTPNGGWNPEGWLPFGGNGIVSIAAAYRNDGRLEVAAIGGDGHAYHRVQYAPGSGWDLDWSLVGNGNNLRYVTLVTDKAGQLRMMALDNANTIMEARESISSTWTTFAPVGNKHLCSITVGKTSDDRLDLFGYCPSSYVYELTQAKTAPYDWVPSFTIVTAWPSGLDQLVTANQANRSDVVFARKAGVVYTATEGTSWGPMTSLGGAYQTDLVAIDQE